MESHAGDLSQDIRPLVRKMGKLPAEWQREDLVRLCREMDIRVVNFRYPSLDGKLRELRLPINDLDYLRRILAAGERVDGSSLFPGIFDTGKSDLYAVPVYRWAFLDPWVDDELHVVCRFADEDGNACADTPDNVLAAATADLERNSGLELQALAELEFYFIQDRMDERFTGRSQRSYHQSAPYLHGRAIADEILRLSARITGCVKYCHSEVGYIDRLESDHPELDGRRVEQYELELDLMPVEDLGAWLTVLRWLVRQVADRHGASVTFVPKLDQGMAGSGLHLHFALTREGQNIMRGDDSQLSVEALGLIGGLLEQASPLTAFGNMVAASYLRLVPGQEAPTRVCWGLHNRSSLVRVPLDFSTENRLDVLMNPGERGDWPDGIARPTVEYRTPDGSALPLLLLAATTACIDEGLSSQRFVDLARSLEISGGIHGEDDEMGVSLSQLPGSAVAAAAALSQSRQFFEQRGFPARLIDHVLEKLESEADAGLNARLKSLPASERLVASRKLMHKDLHKH